MTKKVSLFYALCAFVMICGLTASKNVSLSQVEKGFLNPPDSIKTGVYWYWISGNISKEGVVKDLQSMKAAGINRAFIGDIRSRENGKVLFQSDEWWDIMHTALKTASQLGIEMGIFNSPGWSQSGGPWIKPEEAMRYLASSELKVQGPKKITVKLDKPADPFQDVKVIAYPAPKAESHYSKDPKQLENGGYAYDFVFQSDFTARSLVVHVPEQAFISEAELSVWEGGVYRNIVSFTVDRAEPNITVGFNPFGPAAVSFEATNGKYFRLVLKNNSSETKLAKAELSTLPHVENYVEKTFGKMFQYLQPLWKDYQWRTPVVVEDKSLVVNPADVRDVSQFMTTDGTFTWDVPAGEWVVLRTGMTPTGTKNGPATPEATGLEVDKMSREYTHKHFNSYIKKLMERIPVADRKTFKILIADSYEMGGENYTDDFQRIFKQRYGYDLLPFLPVYYGTVVESPEVSERFLWDMRRLVADRISYEYVGGLREISNKNGLKVWLENYGHWGFPGESLQYGGQSDLVGGEFWCAEDNDDVVILGDTEVRMASSCAHIYGKRDVSAESFTSAGRTYGRYPGVLKAYADRFFTEGMNDNILHLFISQPFEDKFPGINTWYGTEFNRHNTWFSQVGDFVKYIKRVGFMMKQGLNVADVAYFIGEDVPKMDGIQHPPLPKGYQFDYINAEVILRDLSVKNGVLTLPHGTQYRILALPPMETMRPEVLKKIKQLVADGAVVMGAPPKRSPSFENYPQADIQLQEMAKELWGDVDGKDKKYAIFGKGIIINGMSMEDAMAHIQCIPDCRIPDKTPFLYNHRSTGNSDIYFVSNQSSKQQTATLEFRVSGMQPELWDPTTGKSRKLSAFRTGNNFVSVPLRLEASESAIIMFRTQGKPTGESLEVNYPEPSAIREIQQAWNVKFEGEMNVPQPLVMPKLQDWTASADEKVKYFSGTGIYNSTFEIGKLAKSTYINLNDVSVMARVSVNGQFVGSVWTAPYKVDVSKVVKQGKNTITVEVVNNWMNRMIGDMNLPEAQRRIYAPFNPYRAESSLQKSGLMGPVTVEEY